MEQKTITRRLSLANDINTLSAEDLAKKYLKSQTTFEKFLKDYTTFFCNNLLYQLRTYDNYNKLKVLVDYGYMMYPNENNEQHIKLLLTEIDRNLNKYGNNSRHNDIEHAKFSFRIITGGYKRKKYDRYDEMLKGMDKAAKKYEPKKGKSLEDFPTFINYLKYSVNPDDFNHDLNVYLESHPLMKECKDIYFLYYANLVLTKCNDVNPKFIQDVKDVIEVSKTFDRQIIHPIIKNKDYNRVAKFTLKNINRYENRIIDIEKENNQKQLKK